MDGPRLVAYLPTEPRFATRTGRHFDLGYVRSWPGAYWAGIFTADQDGKTICSWVKLNRKIVENDVLPVLGLTIDAIPSGSWDYRFLDALTIGLLTLLAGSLILWLVPSTRARYFPQWPARGGGRTG